MRRPDLLNHATFIWNAADILRGTYKQHQYGDVILPFTVMMRPEKLSVPLFLRKPSAFTAFSCCGDITDSAMFLSP